MRVAWAGSGERGAKPPPPRGPEINITPLVDVVLVLLIIFMVIAPQMQAGQPVAMSEVRHPDAEAKGQFDAITVSVTRDGGVWLEKEHVAALADLRVGLRAALAAAPDRRVVLQADRQAPFKHIRPVFAECQSAGATGVSLKVAAKKPVEAL